MKLLGNPQKFVMALGLSSLLGLSSSAEIQTRLRIWLLKMHKKQLEVLKIDWGRPGFCGEFDRDYDPLTRSCGERGKLIQRRYRD